MPRNNRYAGLLLTLAFTLILGCGASPLPFKVVEQGSAAMKNQEPTFAVIADADQWGEFYRTIHAHRLPPPPAPEVDWSENLAVFVAAGWKPSSGYRVELESVERAGKSLQVTTRFIAPPEGSVAAAVMTQPYVLALVERTPDVEQVRFFDVDGKLLEEINLKLRP